MEAPYVHQRSGKAVKLVFPDDLFGAGFAPPRSITLTRHDGYVTEGDAVRETVTRIEFNLAEITVHVSPST